MGGEIDRLVKFSLVGLSGVLVNEGFLWAFVEFFDGTRCSPTSWQLSSPYSTTSWNDIWTFRDLKNKPLLKRLVSFHVAALSGALVQWAIYVILMAVGVHYLLANLIGIVVSFIVRFAVNRHVTWG